jgi:hypothetical protein
MPSAASKRLQLTRQVAAPHQARRRHQPMLFEADADHVVVSVASSGRWITVAWAPTTVLGPVRTAGERRPVAAKARVMGSECRKGGSMNSQRGSLADLIQAS